MSTDFKGCVAMVTGAGGGLGRCHTPALAALGAKGCLLPGGRIHLVVAA
jgi:NADP-dependent 3-hydroxy acid dehydrogenase YdfG